MVGRNIFDKYGSLIVESDECFKAYPSYPLNTEDRLQVVTLGWTFINDLYAMLSKTKVRGLASNEVMVDFTSYSGCYASGISLPFMHSYDNRGNIVSGSG